MPRRRMIDPNIWQSEDFSKLSTLAKLVFIGLFSNADDEGRGRAKPVYIKSILFPYDEKVRVIDIETALSEIGLNLSVTFYSSNGSQYYALENWKKWQTIDKPKASELPAPQEIEEIRLPIADESSTSSRRVADESRLKIKEEEVEIEEKTKGRGERASGRGPASRPAVECEKFQEIYNSVCTNLPRCKVLTDKRKTAIRAFCKQLSEEKWEVVCQIANNSRFCAGENDRGWKADFDFLIKADKAANVLEGRYGNERRNDSGGADQHTTPGVNPGAARKWGIKSDLDKYLDATGDRGEEGGGD